MGFVRGLVNVVGIRRIPGSSMRKRLCRWKGEERSRLAGSGEGRRTKDAVRSVAGSQKDGGGRRRRKSKDEGEPSVFEIG